MVYGLLCNLSMLASVYWFFCHLKKLHLSTVDFDWMLCLGMKHFSHLSFLKVDKSVYFAIPTMPNYAQLHA